MIKNSKSKSIWKMCMSLLDTAFFNKPEISKKLLLSVQKLINQERLCGNNENLTSKLKSGIEVLIELGNYRYLFL